MRISPKLKLLFLSNPKCGSTTVRKLLDEHVSMIDDTYIKSRKRSQTEFWNHINASEAKELFCKYRWDWNCFLKFTTIRNPFPKMVSNYFFCKPDKNHTPFYRPGYDESTAFKVGFADWVKAFCEKGPNRFTIINFCYDKDECCLVDHILKIEDIDKTLPDILSKVGINISTIPRRNKTEHQPYWEYYDDETRMITEEFFKEDIRIGNYKFGE